jgi:hypothetical protein
MNRHPNSIAAPAYCNNWIMEGMAAFRPGQPNDPTYQAKGLNLKFINALNDGHYRIAFEIAATRELPAASGTFTFFEDRESAEPIIVCLPFGAPGLANALISEWGVAQSRSGFFESG